MFNTIRVTAFIYALVHYVTDIPFDEIHIKCEELRITGKRLKFQIFFERAYKFLLDRGYKDE